MTGSVSPSEMSELIGAVYDCAIDPALWPEVLEQIRVHLGCHNAALTLQAMPSGEHLLTVTANIPQPWLDRMTDYGSDVIDQWGGLETLMTFPADEPAVLTQVNPIAATNRYYLEWGRPQGLADCIAFILARDATSFGSVGFGRHESMGPFRETEIELARLLIPHLQRAATITRLLDIRSIEAATFESVLDSLSVPVVMVGAELEIVHANEAARALLAKGDLVRQAGKRLMTRSGSVTAALAIAVAQAQEDECAIGHHGFGVPVSSGEGETRAFHVLPLRYGELRPGIAPNAVAAIFVGPPFGPRSSVRGDTFARLFQLTQAETRVFEQIAAVRSVPQAAEALGIGTATVRTHLLRLYDKVGVHRQAELVALAASLSLPVGNCSLDRREAKDFHHLVDAAGARVAASVDRSQIRR